MGDRRWVMIDVNQATDAQIRRMKAFGVIATVVPGSWIAGDRYGLDKFGSDGIPIRRLPGRRRAGRASFDGVPYRCCGRLEAIARWDEDGSASSTTAISPGRSAAHGGAERHRLIWNEDRFGSLEAGKVADMAVLAEDPLTSISIASRTSDRTPFLDGRQVFGPE